MRDECRVGSYSSKICKIIKNICSTPNIFSLFEQRDYIEYGLFHQFSLYCFEHAEMFSPRPVLKRRCNYHREQFITATLYIYMLMNKRLPLFSFIW